MIMRRKDREITDFKEMIEILEQCTCARLGFNEDGGAYILPLNFGYRTEGDKLTLYFHGAGSGKKAELLSENPYVGFEADTAHELAEGDTACKYSYKYASIFGKGKAEIIENSEEKAFGLKCFMAHYSDMSFEFDQKMLDAVCVFKLTVTEWTAKAHI